MVVFGRYPTDLHRPCEFNLGDIVVCPSVIETDAFEFGTNVDHHMVVVLTHGLCHLGGFTHATQQETSTMRTEELRILALYEAALGWSPRTLSPLTTFES